LTEGALNSYSIAIFESHHASVMCLIGDRRPDGSFFERRSSRVPLPAGITVAIIVTASRGPKNQDRINGRRAVGHLGKTAYYDIQDDLGRLDKVGQDKAERLRDLEGGRLDALQVGLAPSIRNGDPRAIGVAVRLMERRAKLFGRDAPTQLSGPDGGPLIMKQVIHQQLRDDE